MGTPNLKHNLQREHPKGQLTILGGQFQCLIHILQAAGGNDDFLQSLLPRALQDDVQVGLVLLGSAVAALEHGVRQVGPNVCGALPGVS